jgi:UDP-N-acetylglucosamine 4-epimerase
MDKSSTLPTKSTWLVTGAAGFIGSSLCMHLLETGQKVIGLDNFATGLKKNINEIGKYAEKNKYSWTFHKGDIQDPKVNKKAMRKVDYVLHQAAIGSVPRSIENPLFSHASNVDGFIKVLDAARNAGVKKLIYASSSAVYGDEPNLPKVEKRTGECLSPYATTKAIDELYAKVFNRCYKMPVVGLRYFNVFGPRQDPNGPYAAVIPLWIDAAVKQKKSLIYGDGSNSRDFCYIANVIQANILAAQSPSHTNGKVYNIAYGARTDLNELHAMIQAGINKINPKIKTLKPEYKQPRSGDIPHSHADISEAKKDLGYAPEVDVSRGLIQTIEYHFKKNKLLT